MSDADAARLAENDLQTKHAEVAELQVGDRIVRDEWEEHRIWRVGTVKEINAKSKKLKIAFDKLHIGTWEAKRGPTPDSEPRPHAGSNALARTPRRHPQGT